MKCRVCNHESKVGCLCGFCINCVCIHGHDICEKIIADKKRHNSTKPTKENTLT